MKTHQLGMSAFIVVAAFGWSPAQAQAIRSVVSYSLPPAEETQGSAISIDLNGDGELEHLMLDTHRVDSATDETAAHIYCVDHALNRLKLCALESLGPSLVRAQRVQLLDDNTGRYLTYLTFEPKIRLHPLSAHGPVQQVSIIGSALDYQFVDLDLDQHSELVLARGDRVTAENWPAMTQRWEYQGQVPWLLAGNFDNDPVPEILFTNQTSATVLNGATGQLEWAYPASVGDIMAARPASLNGPAGFMAGSSELTVFQGSPYSPLYSVNISVDEILLYDVNGDGNQDAVVSAGPLVDGAVVDLAQGSLIGNVQFSGASVLAAAPPTGVGAGSSDLRFLSRRYAAGGNVLGTYLANTQGQTLDGLADAYSGYSGVQFADLEQDGTLEAVVLTGREDLDERLHAFSTQNARELWRKKAPFQPFDENDLHDVLVLQADADPQLEILVNGGFFAHYIALIDGATQALQLARENEQSPLRHEPGMLASLELPGEALVMDVYPNGNAIRIEQLRVSDMQLVRSSNLSTTYGRDIHSMLVHNVDADPEPELVLSTNAQVLAFDVSSQTVLWNYPVVSASIAPWNHAGDQGILLIAENGQLTRLNLNGTLAANGADYGQQVLGLAALPGHSSRFLACVDRRLVLLDVVQQTKIAQSRDLGANACKWNHLAVAPIPASSRYRVLVGSVIGMQQFEIDVDRIWSDGAEGSFQFSDYSD